MSLRLHYIHDPLCGWCYAAAPLATAAAAQPDMAVHLHGGGLFPQPMPLPPGMHRHIREADARIAQMTGQVFGQAYLEGLLPDPELRLNSLPPIAAILAAEHLRPGSALAMHETIQRAHYVDGRRVILPETLVDLAVGLGFDGPEFATAMASRPVEAHLEETRALMARFGIGGFPGFVLESDKGVRVVSHTSFYGRPEAFVAALRAAA